jgi:hypothetical protein
MLHHKVKKAQINTRIFFVGTPLPSCAVVPAASTRIVASTAVSQTMIATRDFSICRRACSDVFCRESSENGYTRCVDG